MRSALPLLPLAALSLLGCAGEDDGATSAGLERGELGSTPNPERERGEDDVASRMTAEEAALPALESGRYVFRIGEHTLVVEPQIGGRVTRFSLGGENILTGPEVVAGGEGSLPNMYGSTFWTSPQSTWGWPPEVAIDAAPHAAELRGGVLELWSEPGASTGFAVRKRFWADAARRAFSIEYTLENRSATQPAAPWEISRVPKEGFVLFPAAAEALPQSTLPGTYSEGVGWVDIGQAPAVDSKLFQDGSEGWLAYVHRGLAFIKVFEDIAQGAAAPGEAEIEIFVNGKYEYAEIEQQGRYELPSPGSSQGWRVTWLLERVPPELDARLGSHALVEWARRQVARIRA